MCLLSTIVRQSGQLLVIYTNPFGGKKLDSRSQFRKRATGKSRTLWVNCRVGTSSLSVPSMIEHCTRLVRRRSSQHNLVTLPSWDSQGHRFQDPKTLVSENTLTIPRESIQGYQSIRTRLDSWPRQWDRASVFTEQQSFLNLLLPLTLPLDRRWRGNACMTIPRITSLS